MQGVQWAVMAGFVLFAGLTFLRLISLSREQVVERARIEQARDRKDFD